MLFICAIFLMFSSDVQSFPSGTSLQTSIVAPFSNIGDLSSQKIAQVAQAKSALLPLPSFPESGRKKAVLEQESLTSSLDTKYSRAQQFVADLLHPKPIVDTIQEHEKYGNYGDKGRSVGTFIVAQYEGLSNVLNAAVDLPFEKTKQFGKQITTALNAVGGKLVGL